MSYTKKQLSDMRHLVVMGESARTLDRMAHRMGMAMMIDEHGEEKCHEMLAAIKAEPKARRKVGR